MLIEYDIYLMDSTKLLYCYRIKIKSIQIGAKVQLEQLKAFTISQLNFIQTLLDKQFSHFSTTQWYNVITFVFIKMWIKCSFLSSFSFDENHTSPFYHIYLFSHKRSWSIDPHSKVIVWTVVIIWFNIHRILLFIFGKSIFNYKLLILK